jgi:hypothetical protein
MPTPDTVLIVEDAIRGPRHCLTLYDALSLPQYQAISSGTLPEAEQATQRLDPVNIDLIIANMR